MSETENIKKTQRLSSALYLITGFFSDREPLKWKLRSTATRLVSVYLSEEGDTKRDMSFSATRALIREILALLSVARSAGLVSDMNFEVVSKEFSKLLEAIYVPELSFPSTAEKPVLTDKFFAPTTTVSTPAPQISSAEPVVENVRTFIPQGLLPEVTVESKARPEVQNGTQKEVRKQTPALKEFGAVAVKKNSRQSVIINLLKRKKEIMIKDVSPLIDGVSEKTIQRELLGMVKSGILTKEGEKRWSTYSLAQ